MTDTSLYTIQEQLTVGWTDLETNLTKEQCKQKYNYYLSQGVNPERIRFIRTQ